MSLYDVATVYNHGGKCHRLFSGIISSPLTLIQTEYNMPEIQFEVRLSQFFGIILPVILAIIIPVISISGELSKAPLEL